MTLLSLALVLICTSWVLAGLGATFLFRRRELRLLDLGQASTASTALPPVTVMKPLRGADAGLEANLRSFFEQDHPNMVLLFGVKDADDPAVAVVRKLQDEYPAVESQLVVHDTRAGSNPKVENLIGMRPAVPTRLAVISDSNIRAPRHYVRELVTVYLTEPRAGIVTNLFCGVGEDGLGAALESVHLNGYNLSGIALPNQCGDVIVVGKSMLFDLPTFESLGGLDEVRDVLAEDFRMGHMFADAGLRTITASTLIDNITSRQSFPAFLDRQVRWAMLRWRLRPAMISFEWLTYPMIVLPFAIPALGVAPAIGWALALVWARDVVGWWLTRGTHRIWLPFILGPVRDLVMLVVWARASVKRHVSWRGHRVFVGSGTLARSA